MRIVCISDTHSLHGQFPVPEGDVLVHAGDATRRGSEAELRDVNHWLGTLPHRHKVLVAGNHDFGFQTHRDAAGWITNAHYLQDRSVVIEGVRFYGSPWQPWFHDWAFNLPRGAELRRVWDRIPAGTDRHAATRSPSATHTQRMSASGRRAPRPTCKASGSARAITAPTRPRPRMATRSLMRTAERWPPRWPATPRYRPRGSSR